MTKQYTGVVMIALRAVCVLTAASELSKIPEMSSGRRACTDKKIVD